MDPTTDGYVTIDGHFFGDKDSDWVKLGISLLTGCVFSPYVLGLIVPGIAAEIALVYGCVSAIMLALLGRVLVPFFLKLKVSTFPEYFEHRFDRKSRLFVSAIIIAQNMIFRLMIVLGVGGVLIGRILHVDAFSSLLLFLIIAGIYVILGGLKAEVYASSAQMLLIFIGAAAVIIWGIQGGSGSAHAAPATGSIFLVKETPHSFPTWISLMAGLPILGFWFWCADQSVLQKVLSARDLAATRKASLLSGLLQVVPIVVVILLGRAISYPSSPASGEQAFQVVVRSVASSGIPGDILILAVASALVALFAGIFDSTSLLITYDFYRCSRPAASDRSLVFVGRITSITLLACSMLIIPVTQTLRLDSCLQLFAAFTGCASMVTALFLVGIFNRQINSTNALVGLSAGSCIILFRLAAGLLGEDSIVGGGFTRWLGQLDFMEFSLVVFILTVTLLFLSSGFERLLKKGGEGPRKEAPATSWSTVSFPEQTSKEQQ